MYLMGMIILSLCLVADLTFHTYFLGILIKSQLSLLFLAYSVLRRDLALCLFLLIFYALIVKAFTGLGFTTVILPSIIIYGFFYNFRNEIYTGSYLIQSFWASVMLFLQWMAIAIIDFQSFDSLFSATLLLNIFVNLVFSGLCALVLFRVWDVLLRMLKGQRSLDDKDFGLNLTLNDTQRSNELL